jgi:hypothetical protein
LAFASAFAADVFLGPDFAAGGFLASGLADNAFFASVFGGKGFLASGLAATVFFASAFGAKGFLVFAGSPLLRGASTDISTSLTCASPELEDLIFLREVFLLFLILIRIPLMTLKLN